MRSKLAVAHAEASLRKRVQNGECVEISWLIIIIRYHGMITHSISWHDNTLDIMA